MKRTWEVLLLIALSAAVAQTWTPPLAPTAVAMPDRDFQDEEEFLPIAPFALNNKAFLWTDAHSSSISLFFRGDQCRALTVSSRGRGIAQSPIRLEPGQNSFRASQWKDRQFQFVEVAGQQCLRMGAPVFNGEILWRILKPQPADPAQFDDIFTAEVD